MATHFSLKKMAVLALLSRGLGTPDSRVFLVKDKTKEKSAVLELYVAGVQLPTYQKGIVEDLHGLLALILLPCLVQSYATEVISTPIAGGTFVYCRNYILPKLYTAKIIYYQNYILPKLYTARIIYCPGYFYN